ncbi:MAG TPA: hypothetical protein VIY70_02505 [Acidimicrobiia bacterium]
MSIRTTIAAAAAGALLAVPVTAGAVGTNDSTEPEPPCGANAEWMANHWNDPQHRDEMASFMAENWNEMGSHMFSGEFDHGPGMMGGSWMQGSTERR